MVSSKVRFNWLSSDGEVYAYRRWPASGECNIHEFVPETAVESYSRRALGELRPLYEILRAVHCDNEYLELEFWLAMAREKLIDVVLDANGERIWP